MPTPDAQQTQAADAVRSARQALADLIGAPAEGIETRSVDTVEWPDACLGWPSEGEACAEAVTPGYLITFFFSGKEYQVHTNQSGSQVRIASPDIIQPPGANEPIEAQSWTPVTVEEAGLSFEVPVEWTRLEPAWRWAPEPGSLAYLGVDWAEIEPPTEPEAAMLPENAVMLERIPVELGWTTAYRYKAEVYKAASQGESEAQPEVTSVDYHILITSGAGDGRRVVDFHASAPSEGELGQLEPLLDAMVHSLQPLTE